VVEQITTTGTWFEEATRDERVEVRLKEVRVERGRRFGDVFLGWTLWRALGLDGLMEEMLPAGREEVPWATIASVLVLARLTEPSSELHIAEDWFRKSALDSLLDVPAEKVNEDRLYRGLDLLVPRKEGSSGKSVLDEGKRMA
jgi:hypothetical protein